MANLKSFKTSWNGQRYSDIEEFVKKRLQNSIKSSLIVDARDFISTNGTVKESDFVDLIVYDSIEDEHNIYFETSVTELNDYSEENPAYEAITSEKVLSCLTANSADTLGDIHTFSVALGNTYLNSNAVATAELTPCIELEDGVVLKKKPLTVSLIMQGVTSWDIKKMGEEEAWDPENEEVIDREDTITFDIGNFQRNDGLVHTKNTKSFKYEAVPLYGSVEVSPIRTNAGIIGYQAVYTAPADVPANIAGQMSSGTYFEDHITFKVYSSQAATTPFITKDIIVRVSRVQEMTPSGGE